MAMLRPWASVLCAPRRCSTSDTVPMTLTSTCPLLWKKPLRKGGSCPRSRLPCCGGGGRWAVSSGAPFEAPSQTPIHAWARMLYHPTPSHPGSAVQGDVLLALVCPLGIVDRQDRLPLSETLGSSWGQGSANPCQSAARSFLSVPFLARGSPTKSWRPTFPSSVLPCLCPPFLASPGDRGVLGARQDKFGWAGTA